jgi:hypothetical protein
MTAIEYAEIAGVPTPESVTKEQAQALIQHAGRALAVRRALAIREIEEQAAALDEHDRERLIRALS